MTTNQATSRSRFDQLTHDLHRLGVNRRPSGRVRVAIHRRAQLKGWFLQVTISITLALTISIVLIQFIDAPTREEVTRMNEMFPKYKPSEREIEFWTTFPDWPMIPILTAFFMLATGEMSKKLRGGHPWFIKNIDSFRAARRYAPVMVITDAISACADAYGSDREDRAPALRQVSRRLGAVTRSLRTAYKHRSSVPRRSHRRKILDSHARQVIAAIRKSEERLDRDPQAALQELGGILLTISDRYCEARVGALLDNEQIEGAQPGHDYEWLRIVAWAALSAGAVISISKLDLSEGPESIVTIFAVLAIMAIIWNRKVRQAFDLLNIVTGGP
ncbi:hypothetical protein [Streptomyces sp. NPDC007991]|uniref:hypothetical protein n=1 Tax=Streptomyces sp. NPDC007991 TaxID=3364803 RepID=UPI0036ECC4D7